MFLYRSSLCIVCTTLLDRFVKAACCCYCLENREWENKDAGLVIFMVLCVIVKKQ